MNEFLVPFGKYQGYSIDVLFNDKNYLYWFLCESDAIVNHRETHREIIRRLVYQEKTYNKIPPNSPNFGNRAISFTNPLAERNQILSEFINTNFDWSNFASNFFKHEIKGEASNISFFSDSFAIQFEYENNEIENFNKTHLLFDVITELTDDFEFVLKTLAKTPTKYENFIKYLIVSQVTALGFSEDLLIRIFATNGIQLHILNPKPKTITFGSKVSSNEFDKDFPF